MNLLYVKILAGIFCVLGIWYNGYSLGYSKLTNYKLAQETETRKKEAEQQTATDQIRKTKDAQIANINNQLADALISLRSRSSRTDQTNNGSVTKTCDGSQLFAEDGIFLAREASRADTIRISLQACYDQYDAIK